MIRSIHNSLKVITPKISAIVVDAKEQDHMQMLLRTAVQRNQLLQAKWAIERGAPINRQDLQANDNHNDYHLVRASYLKANAIANLLIQSGANVNVTCQHGHTPLIVASSGRFNHTLIRSLLSAKANVHQQDKEGKTALMEAASSHDLHSVYMLIRAGARCEDQDNNGRTSLFFALQYKPFFRTLPLQHIEVIKKLITSSSVNLADKNGMTPLMLAASHGLIEITKLLITAGADRSALNLFEETALMIAEKQRQEKDQRIQNYDKIISLLKNTSGHLEEFSTQHNKDERLGSAIHFNRIDEVQKLISEGHDIHKGSWQGPYLAQAARLGHFEIVQILLHLGANPKQMLRMETALDKALMYRSLKQEELADLNHIIEYLTNTSQRLSK